MKRVALKSDSRSDASEAIVVSFDSRWFEQLRSGNIRLFLRKRGPRSTSTHWVYVYVAAPVSSIVGRFRIQRHEVVDLESALSL
jgi:predicted transcriptional regulator